MKAPESPEMRLHRPVEIMVAAFNNQTGILRIQPKHCTGTANGEALVNRDVEGLSAIRDFLAA